MPRPPLPGPDSSNNDGYSTLVHPHSSAAGFETNLAELADRLSARVPDPALSADLALQIVLNEIAEQACLTIGATGAAIALERNDALVCRASSGSTAPELGAPLNAMQGLSGECVRTRQIQVCGDIENDSRADAGASRQLGARSVMMLPLVRGEKVVGVLEAFSTRPDAFGEQDQEKLEALGQRIIHNIELAADWSPATSATVAEGEPSNGPQVQAAFPDQSSANDRGSSWPESAEADNAGPSHRMRMMTYVLGVMVLVTAIGLWARIFERLGWVGPKVESHAVVAGSAATSPAASTPTNAAASSRADDPSLSLAPPMALTSASSGGKQAAVESAPATKPVVGRTLPPGSLAVYDNGREVFRMVPGQPTAVASAGVASKDTVRQAVSIEPQGTATERVMAATPATSEGNLVHSVAPEYPEEARQQKIQGAVVLDVRAGRDGSVQHVQLISGHPLLAAAAIAAVNQWRFKPQVVNGQGTDIETRVTLDFKLPQ